MQWGWEYLQIRYLQNMVLSGVEGSLKLVRTILNYPALLLQL